MIGEYVRSNAGLLRFVRLARWALGLARTPPLALFTFQYVLRNRDWVPSRNFVLKSRRFPA